MIPIHMILLSIIYNIITYSINICIYILQLLLYMIFIYYNLQLGDKYTRLLDQKFFESLWKYDAIGIGLLFQSDPNKLMYVSAPPIAGYIYVYIVCLIYV